MTRVFRELNAITPAVETDQHRSVHRRNQISSLTAADARIAEELFAARNSAVALSGFPGSPPVTLGRAYQIQASSMARWPDTVSGWKVGGIPEQHRHSLGADWLVGPIFERSAKQAAGSTSVPMPVFDGGFAAIEPELVVQIGNTRAEDRMFIGAEIASSPVPAINDYGPTAVVCDFGNNNGLLLGAEIANWQHSEEPLEVSIWIDDTLISSRTLEGLSAHASRALQFCLDHAAQQGRELRPGMFVSTGAITGIHEANVGAGSKISFGKWGVLHLHLTKAERLNGLP